MTLLQLIQQFCRRNGLVAPTAVVDIVDDTSQQLLALLNELLETLTLHKGTWQALQREATFTSVAAESQGELTTLADEGFQFVLNNTLFNRTTGRRLCGPLSPEQWQQMKAMTSTGELSYRIVRGELLLLPAPAAGETIAFEYASTAAVVSASDELKSYFTADTDTCVFPDSLMLQGLRWMWLERKGLPYAEAMRTYELSLVKLFGHDGTKVALNLSETGKVVGPAVLVPRGSWDL